MLFRRRSAEAAPAPGRLDPPRGAAGLPHPVACTVIGRRTLIRGIVKGDGPVVIHGALEGELTLGGALSISPTSRVDAEIEARSVEISGETRGTLAAAGRVILEAGGVFDGELTTPVLEVRPGSVLRGRARVSGLQTLARRRVSH